MKSVSSSRALFVGAIILAISGALWAQKPNGNTAPKYDIKNEVTVKGTVQDIKTVPGPLEGVHLLLKTETETILVHVAPEKFLSEMETSFNKGDVLEVVGCKIKDADGSDELLARQITKSNNNEIVLRDKKGTPVWTQWNPGSK
jgi:DNA/RNA endonuclease YhcR with UshA esterase domain